jgi:hypothetical protein
VFFGHLERKGTKRSQYMLGSWNQLQTKDQNGRMDVRILYTEKIYAYFFAKS